MHPTPTDSLPRAVAWLGYGGLLPFLGAAVLAVVDPAHAGLWRNALIAYGAVILSFVGGLHWGFAMTLAGLSNLAKQRCFVWSVVPALVAWPALLLPSAWGGALLIAGFVAHYAQDVRLSRRADLPQWYLPLRLRLTTVACACLAVGVFV
ncbi:MAG: DUF3429 domain-containing protein [Thiobacillus sp.]